MISRKEGGKGLTTRKTNWLKSVAQERQEMGWKTFTETKHVGKDRGYETYGNGVD